MWSCRGKRLFFNFEEFIIEYLIFQDEGQFLKISLQNNLANSEAGGWMLRKILGNFVKFLAALSTASFSLIPIRAAGSHVKVRNVLQVVKMWRKRRIRCTSG